MPEKFEKQSSPDCEDLDYQHQSSFADTKQVTLLQENELGRGLSNKALIADRHFCDGSRNYDFIPSVANFRNVWLQNHLDIAEAASIVYF